MKKGKIINIMRFLLLTSVVFFGFNWILSDVFNVNINDLFNKANQSVSQERGANTQ